MNEIKIHDIKQLVEIPDISFYIFIALIILIVAFIGLISFLIYKYFNNKKRNLRKEYYKILKDISFDDTKQTAYTISKYTRLLATSDLEIKLCKELIEELEKYKYKKNVEKFDGNVKVRFGIFMDSLDV